LFAKGPALPDGANPNFSAVAARPPTDVRLWHDADIPRARTLVDPLILRAVTEPEPCTLPNT